MAGRRLPVPDRQRLQPWALVPGDPAYSLANAGLWVCDVRRARDRLRRRASPLFGPLPAVVVGTALLLAAIVADPVVSSRGGRTG